MNNSADNLDISKENPWSASFKWKDGSSQLHPKLGWLLWSCERHGLGLLCPLTFKCHGALK